MISIFFVLVGQTPKLCEFINYFMNYQANLSYRTTNCIRDWIKCTFNMRLSFYLNNNSRSHFALFQRQLTVVKLDVEEWEMLALPNMISDGTLKSVKQLLIEFHITMRPEPDKQRYIRGLNILIDLYEQGFRIFWTKRNLFCRFTSLEEDIERTGCHEISFVNINTLSTVL